MDLDIDGNTALVTASSSGLGKASGIALARAGANVVLNGRDENRLEDAVAEVDKEGSGEVIGVAADLTVPADIDRLVEESIDTFGGLDHLVTSAGGPPSGAFLDIPEDAWYDAYDLLVMSVVRTVKAATPHLQADGGGTIVTITSQSVKEAIDSLVLSNAVRMGVIGLEKTLSRELAPEIRVNAVLPGAHRTARIEELAEQAVERGDYASVEAAHEARASDIPVGRMGDPLELGQTVAFLSSPQSGFINGAAIPIDGGGTRSNL